MGNLANIVERRPTAAEYAELIAAVGWRRREPQAIEVALRNSLYAVCAEVEDQIVGCGRVIGDGGLHFYLTDVIVLPPYQRRGIGSAIVAALTRHLESIPYMNTLVAVLPTPGSAPLYARNGYKAQGPDSPVMQRWIHRGE